MIDKNDPRLTAYLLDELSPQEVSVVEAALQESPELQSHLDDLRFMTVRMNQTFKAADNHELTMTDSQLQQLDAAANSNEPSNSQVATEDYSAPSQWRNLALAALILYAVGLSLFAFRKPVITASSPSLNVPNKENRVAISTGDLETVNADPIAETRSDELINRRTLELSRRRLERTSLLERRNTDSVDPPDIVVVPVETLEELASDRLEPMGRITELSISNPPSKTIDRGDLQEDRFYKSYADPADIQDGPIAKFVLPTHEKRLQETVSSYERFMVTPRLTIEEEEAITGFDTDSRRFRGVAVTPDSKPVDGPVTRRLSLQLETVAEGEISQIEATVREAVAADGIVSLEKKASSNPAPRTWKPAAAATNRARLSVGHHDDLTLTARDTYVRIDGFRARVFFDCYYYNDRPQQLEGQFMLRLPNDASLHYFAFGPATLPSSTPAEVPTGKPGEPVQDQLSLATAAVRRLRELTATNGSDLARRAGDSNFAPEPNSTFGLVKTARVAPRQKAALAYDETVRRRVDPALVEWAGPGIFQTRVFPLVPNQLHRIIIGYDVNLLDDGDDRVFTLPLPEGDAGGRVEFDIAAAAGTQVKITPETDAFVSGGRAYYRYEQAEARKFTARVSGTESVVLNSGNETDAYFATKVYGKLPEAATESDSPQAVFLLDTSWSDRPAAFSRRLKLLETVLEKNRDTIKEFAVLQFNVEQRWWRSEFSSNDAVNVAAFMTDASQLALEGATDLHAALAEATVPSWAPKLAATAPHPNFFLFSDAAATWGQTDFASLSDPLTHLNQNADQGAGGGALFAYHFAGHSSDKATLDWLAHSSGGAVFDVAELAELESVAIAHRSRPWQIVGATATGADEILVQGASKTVYPNQALVIAGRGHIDGALRIEFQRGIEKQVLEFAPKLSIASPAAARLFGQLAVERLEPYAESVDEAVTVAFARYFRVPGRTCSLVMLDSQQDYERMGVNVSPEEDRLVIASTSIANVIEEQESVWREQRQQPRQRFIAWVDSLHSASLLSVSTALRLAMKRLPESAFRFDARRLDCRSWKTEQLSNSFNAELLLEEPGFDAVMEEAERKLIAFGADDALKTASTAIEAKPADVDTLRSVAFRAMQWQRSDQAAPLLWRLTQARPYQPQCLLLLARAMSESGDTDAAIVCYDLVSSGNWNPRWSGAKEIAQVELLSLLEQISSGHSKTSIPQYANARLQQLRRVWCKAGMDIAVIMHWNTDRTDVDLHVTEPGGEECFYSHNRTASGGRLTQDITEGLGPEMYSLEHAPKGDFKVEAKYFGSDTNRTKAPTETLLTILRNVGRADSQSQTKRITLKGTGEKQLVTELSVAE